MAARDDKAAAFTQSAARRVVRAVRLVERGSRDIHAAPLRTAWDDGGSSVRLAKFVGAWPLGESKTVTLYHSDDGETVEATNRFCSIPGECPGERWCAVFGDGGEWYLLAAQCGDA